MRGRPLSFAVFSALICVCLSSCTQTKSKATCGVGGRCWECPNADAAMLCLSKLDGDAAGCKPTDPKDCR